MTEAPGGRARRLARNQQEAGLYGVLAGHYRVPVAMASGDDVFIAGNRDLFPWTVFVQTKRAAGCKSGLSLSPDRSREAIRAGVLQGLEAVAGAAPLVLPGAGDGDLEVRRVTTTVAMADLSCQWPAFERLGGTGIGFRAARIEAAVRMLNCCSAMSAMLR